MPARSLLLALSVLAVACGPSSDPDDDSAAMDSGPLPDTAELVDTDTDVDTDTESDTAQPSVPLLHEAPLANLSGRVLCWLPEGGPLDCWPIEVTFDTSDHEPPVDWTAGGYPRITDPYFDAGGGKWLVSLTQDGQAQVWKWGPGGFPYTYVPDTAAESFLGDDAYVWAQSASSGVAGLTRSGEFRCYSILYEEDICPAPPGMVFEDYVWGPYPAGGLDSSGGLHQWFFIPPEEANLDPSRGPFREVSRARGCAITEAAPSRDLLCLDVRASEAAGSPVMFEPKKIEQPHGLDKRSTLYMGCALDALDRVQCWGDTASPLHYRDLLEGVPTDTGYDKVQILSEDLACAIRGDRVRCWGDLATPENLGRMPLLPPLP